MNEPDNLFQDVPDDFKEIVNAYRQGVETKRAMYNRMDTRARDYVPLQGPMAVDLVMAAHENEILRLRDDNMGFWNLWYKMNEEHTVLIAYMKKLSERVTELETQLKGNNEQKGNEPGQPGRADGPSMGG